MILDWKLADPPSSAYPIGQPFTARRSYMAVFCVLESLAMRQLGDDDLCRVSASLDVEAFDEMNHRRALDR